jgi:hypothetical protein
VTRTEIAQHDKVKKVLAKQAGFSGIVATGRAKRLQMLVNQE